MIKKLTIIVLLSLVIISCGKKGCPKNNDDDKCKELFLKKK